METGIEIKKHLVKQEVKPSYNNVSFKFND